MCADLRTLLPRLRASGGPAFARIELVVDLSGYYLHHEDERPMRGRLLDRATSLRCPEVRRDVLSAIDQPSFTEFFAF